MRNSKGNALIIVLILIASVMATSAVVMQNSASVGQIFARKSSSQVADNVAQLISSLMSDPNVCLVGFDGAGSEKGLEFLDSSNAPSTFNSSAAATAEQNVTLPSNFPNASGGRNRFEAGFAIPDSELRIFKLYVTGVQNTAANQYTMKLMAQLEAVQGTAVRGMSPRLIMKIGVQTSGANVISCGAAPDENSNQSLCEGMNCTYTVSTTGASNCFCPVKPVDCLNGTYVQSIVNFTPQCSSATISRSCPSPQLLVALDSSTNPVCVDVLSCPAGTSAVGPGGPADPPECKCVTAGQTWNSSISSCVTNTLPGLCVAGADSMIDMFDGQMGDPCGQAICIARNYLSAAYGGTGLFASYAPCAQAAPGDTCLSRIRFPNGTCRTSTRCEVYAATCAPASLPVCTGGATTTVTTVLASPTGCFCAAGQTWDTATSTCTAASCVAGPPNPSNSLCPVGSTLSTCGTGAYYCTSINTNPSDPTNPQTARFRSSTAPAGYGNCIDDSTGSCSLDLCTNLSCTAGPTCTGGATTTTSTNLASPAGCYCAAGQTWNGATSTCTATVTLCSPTGSQYRWSGSAWLPLGGPLPPAWDFSILNSPGYTLTTAPDPTRWGWPSNTTAIINVGGGVLEYPSNNFQHGPANTILECRPCTGGATTTVSSIAATPLGCYCTTAETWNTTNLSCEPATVRTCTAAGAEWPSLLAQGGLDNWNATWTLLSDPFIESSWDSWRATWAGSSTTDRASGIYLSTGWSDVRSLGGWVSPNYQLPACTSALNGAKAFVAWGNGPTGSRWQWAYQCVCP